MRDFWQENGFLIAVNVPEAGVMETDWAENRAKLPQDVTTRHPRQADRPGLLDRRARQVPHPAGAQREDGNEIYISHRGMVEVAADSAPPSTMLRAAAAPPDRLEAEFLRRLMVRLGTQEEKAKQLVAAGGAARQARAAIQTGIGGFETLEVFEPFDRAWRRVGLALDRVGFTVEDRDRQKGQYFVRYADTDDSTWRARTRRRHPVQAAFWKSSDADPEQGSVQYRVQIPGKSVVQILNKEGAQANTDTRAPSSRALRTVEVTLRFASIGSGSKGNCLVAEAATARACCSTAAFRRARPSGAWRASGLRRGHHRHPVTHEHDDHAGQAYPFAAQHQLPVWLTYGTQAAMAESGKPPGDVETRTIVGRSAFAIGDLEVRPYTVPHDAREPVQFVLSDGAFRLGVLHRHRRLDRARRSHAVGLRRAGARVQPRRRHAVGRRVSEVAEGADRRPFGHLSNRDAGSCFAALDRSKPEARDRGAPVAAEQPAGTRARSAGPRDGLRCGLDRPVDPGRGLRLARTEIKTAALYKPTVVLETPG